MAEKTTLPVDYHKRRYEQLSFAFELPMGDHVATLKWLNPKKEAAMKINSVLVYGDAPEAPAK